MEKKEYCVKIFFDYDLVKEVSFLSADDNKADEMFRNLIRGYAREFEKEEYRETLDVTINMRLYRISEGLMFPEYLAQYSFEKLFGFPPSGGELIDLCGKESNCE